MNRTGANAVFHEPARRIPVRKRVDVLVAGAGATGIIAAIAAGRTGARTLLIDPFATPGGTSTIGIGWTQFHDGQKLIVRGIVEELMRRMVERGAMNTDWAESDWPPYDVEMWKLVTLEALLEAKVQLLMHTQIADTVVQDGCVKGVIVQNKNGRQFLPSRVTLDTTGDADVAFLAGVPCEKGRSSDGGMQPASFIFTVGGVDVQRYHAAGDYECFKRLYREVSKRENFSNPRRGESIPGPQIVPGRRGEVSFNVTRICSVDCSDPDELTRAEVEGRLQAREFVEKFLRPHLPGFEHCYVVQTAHKVGVRETRRIVGEYVLTAEDVMEYRVPPDTICRNAYPIDIHNPHGDGTQFRWQQRVPGRSYGIPWRSLLPQRIDGLLVGGRCLSATHEALSAVRVMSCCMGMGQAIGTAAALCCHSDVTPRRLDVTLLQRRLLADGAYLGPEIENLLPVPVAVAAS